MGSPQVPGTRGLFPPSVPLSWTLTPLGAQDRGGSAVPEPPGRADRLLQGELCLRRERPFLSRSWFCLGLKSWPGSWRFSSGAGVTPQQGLLQKPVTSSGCSESFRGQSILSFTSGASPTASPCPARGSREKTLGVQKSSD